MTNRVGENGTASLCVSFITNSHGTLNRTLVGCFAILFALVNIMSNGLLIFALCKSKQLQTFSNQLVFIMTVCDLCTGIFVLPALGTHWIIGKHKGCLELKCIQFAMIFLGYTSFLMVICISVDRYFHVKIGVRYIFFANTYKKIWLKSVFIALGFFVGILYVTFVSFYFLVVMVFLNVLLISWLLILNTKTLGILIF